MAGNAWQKRAAAQGQQSSHSGIAAPQDFTDNYLQNSIQAIEAKNIVNILFSADEAKEKGVKGVLEKSLKTQRFLARVDNLVSDLIKTGHLIIINPVKDHIVGSQIFGTIIDGTPSKVLLSDATTAKFILANFYKEVVPTPLLTALVKNDFKSDEEVRFEAQQMAENKRFRWGQIITIGLSAIVGLSPLAWTIYDSHSQNKCKADDRKAESARWQAFLAIESNKVAGVGGLSNGLVQVAGAVDSLAKEGRSKTNAASVKPN